MQHASRFLVSVIMSSDIADTSEASAFCPWASHFMPLTADKLLGWVSSCSRAEEVRKIFEAAKSIHFIDFRKGRFGTDDDARPVSTMSCHVHVQYMYIHVHVHVHVHFYLFIYFILFIYLFWLCAKDSQKANLITVTSTVVV